MEAATSFFLTLVFTVSTIYRLQTVHLDPLQLVLVGTVLEATCFLFEVPTGVVADTFSRRLSIIIGTFLLGAGIGLEGYIPTFAVVLLGQVVSGIGYTFLSGATQAWIADEVGEEHLGPVFIRAGQLGQAGGILGLLASVAIGSVQIGLPIVLGSALTMALAILLVFIMPETGFKPTPREDRTTWQAMGHTFTQGVGAVRRQPRLATFLVIEAFFGLASEGWDRLAEAHLLLNFTFPQIGSLSFQPIVWLGAINLVGSLLAIGASEIARRRIKIARRDIMVKTITVLAALRIASTLLFALAGSFAWALVGRWSRSMFGSVEQPLYGAWVTQSIDSQVRATVLSMTSQINAVGQIAGGPIMGGIAKLVSVPAAIAVSGLVLAPVLPLYGRAHRQGEDHDAGLAEAAVAVEV